MPQNPSRNQALKNAFNKLAEEGLVVLSEAGPVATKRWQAALARAALRLSELGDEGEDMRVPIAQALYELCGDRDSDDELIAKVDAMLSVQKQAFEALQAQLKTH